ncbi:hypothetical protein SNOG_00684 [Parastagonospora nodorum SN15]|uniref:Uncharacterized protein n=1 Tax=Phaeosphaeria nodorum (strain SN15 / ATCC MYA-4574 / FGSC 10173) TaxID=321614 RepID=Q0V5N0_PHANO|nr:hypothetical protein SNOG_00684 [Parastagonospora nodorum SN15]EAT92179.1 hypothetical protein SNOG_00684 [Parastagonospora nodorum SN15]
MIANLLFTPSIWLRLALAFVVSRLALSDPRWQDAAALCIVKLLWIWAENMDMCA